MSPGRRGAALFGAVAALAFPSFSQAAPDPYHLTPELAHVARNRRADLGAGPAWRRRGVMKISPLAEWGGGAVQYLVLRSMVVEGSRWFRVRLPERPNDDAGWISADLTASRPRRGGSWCRPRGPK